jgi:hypothetical protein
METEAQNNESPKAATLSDSQSFLDSLNTQSLIPSQTTVKTFLDRASLLTERNIPVIPVNPRTKACTLSEWNERATTDPQQLQKWAAERPDYNTGAVAKRGNTWTFDLDDPALYETLKQDGVDLETLRTIKVRGGKAAPCGHYTFRHNAESEALENCSWEIRDRATGKKIKTRFDAMIHDRYVVGPGSIHPEGPVYTIVDDSPIVEAPPELIYWVEKNAQIEWVGEGSKGPQEANSLVLRNDFDRSEMIARCDAADYDYGEVKKIIADYGFAHRHERGSHLCEPRFRKTS